MEPIIEEDTKYWLQNDYEGDKHLCIEGNQEGFFGNEEDGVLICPLNNANAETLRGRIHWLNPQPLGLATSFGFGDRLGLATPGHIAAVKGTGIAPIFAQQSVRENERTGRNPQNVLDDAMWAVFEANWQEPWGADADHVKEICDLPPFLEAGYSFFTLDPNQYVDNDANSDQVEILKSKVEDLPWQELDTSLEEWTNHYLDRLIKLDGINLKFTEETLLRAAGKYGRSVAHIKSISDHLVENVPRFDLEISVDETDTPTSIVEHYFVANELRRLKVPFISLAPRFIGSFEKGVDYVSPNGELGEISEFGNEMEKHAAVMQAIGGYKLSIHTGSDKFSIYPVLAESTQNLVHVKTAGTSYLEALRVVATVDQRFFLEILDFSRDHYETDRMTYHVSGELSKVPATVDISDDSLFILLNDFDTRQVLHVTYGSVLDQFGTRLKQILATNSDTYCKHLKVHFKHHLTLFMNSDKSFSHSHGVNQIEG